MKLLFNIEIIDSSPTTNASSETAASAASLASSVTSKLISGFVSALPLINSGSANAAVFLQFSGDLELYQLINVNFPSNFISFCQQLSSSPIPNFISLWNENDYTSTTGKFHELSYSTIFFDNSGANFNKYGVAFCIIFVTEVLNLSLHKAVKIKQFLQKVQSMFVWNATLAYIIGDYSNNLLSIFLQFREGKLDSAYTWFSLAASIIMFVFYLALLGLFAYLLNRKQPHESIKLSSRSRTSKRKDPIATRGNVPKSLDLISEPYHQEKFFSRNFFLIYLIDSTILVIIVSFLQDFGLAQAILYTIFSSVLLFLVIVFYRPHKSAVELLIYVLKQAVKILFGGIAIFLGYYDTTIDAVGVALIAIVIIVNVVNFIIVMSVAIRDIIRKCKTRKNIPQISKVHC